MSFVLEMECGGFQLAEYHVPPFQLFTHQLGFVRWPGSSADPMLLQVDRVMHGLAPELKTRPMESTGNGPFYVISVRLQLARSGIALFTTEGTDPAHVELVRNSITVVSQDQVEGCGLEVLTAGSPLGDSEMPQSSRIFITRFEMGEGRR